MKVGVFFNYIGIGANLLHLSYCHEIAKKYGPLSIITLCNKLDQALEDDPNIEEIIVFKKNKNITDIPYLSLELKKLKFDIIFIFYPSPRIYLSAKLAGIKKIYNYPLFKKKNLHLIDAAKKFTCKSLNIKDCPTETNFIVSEDKIKKTEKYFNKEQFNIVIGAGSSGPDTRWGEKNFSDLINKLNQNGNYFFYIQSGPEQSKISNGIIENVNKKNCIDLSKLNIREIVPFLYLCDMYVGNDSFSHHITSQSKKPSLVILLDTPKAYTDYSIYHHRIIPDGINLNDMDHNSKFKPSTISVEKVFNKIIEIKS